MKILKIGGSLIAPKTEKEPAFKKAVMDKISKALAEYVSWAPDLLIVHGAGTFGHSLVKKMGFSGIKSEDDRSMFAEIHDSCQKLSSGVLHSLSQHKIPAMYVQPSAVIIQREGRIEHFDTEVIDFYLLKKIIPVLHGDVVPDYAKGASVCSGDQIVAWFAKKAEVVVFATNVDGILDKKGRLIERIDKTNLEKMLGQIGEAENDVTGGMKGKVREIIESRAPAWIVNGNHPDRIVDALSGKVPKGTYISTK